MKTDNIDLYNDENNINRFYSKDPLNNYKNLIPNNNGDLYFNPSIFNENYDYFKHNSIIIYIKRKPLPKTLEKNRPLSQDLAAWEGLFEDSFNLCCSRLACL